MARAPPVLADDSNQETENRKSVCLGGAIVNQQISEGRKTVYYAGIVLTVIGGLMFASVFVTAVLHFGDFADFEARGAP